MSEDLKIATINIQQWLMDGRTMEQIENDLLSKGYDSNSIAAHIHEYKKQRIIRQQFKGFIFLGIGAVTGFISCVLTITNLFPGWYDFFLFGLTSFAIIAITIGLYFVFEA